MSCRTEPSSRFVTKILIRLPTEDHLSPGPVNFSNTMPLPSGDQSGFPRYAACRWFLKAEPSRLTLEIVQEGTCNRSLVPSGDQESRESPTDWGRGRRRISEFARSRMDSPGFLVAREQECDASPSGDQAGISTT